MHSSNIGINLLRKHRKNNINRKQQKLTKKNHNMLSFDELRNQRKKFSRLSHIKLEHFYKTIRKSIAKKRTNFRKKKVLRVSPAIKTLKYERLLLFISFY